MAEGIAFVSSIIAVIQVSSKIISITKHYIECTQDAPRDLHVIRIEISTLKAVFESLELLQSSSHTFSDGLKRLSDQDGAIEGCRRSLIELDKLLTPSHVATGGELRRKFQTTLSGLAWPLKEAKAKKLLSEISRYKSLINLSLSAESVHDVKALREHQITAEQQAILDWITPINYNTQHNDFISGRQPGTGQWLLDSAEFKTWVDTGNQLFFCPGIPGAGKTILTSTVIENLQTRFADDQSVGIAFLYCNFRRKHEQKAKDLLASMLKQLACGQPSMPDIVISLYEKHERRQTHPSFDEILRTLQSVTAMYSRLFVIVDALDECDGSDCRKFLPNLLSLKTEHGANVFATSRFVPEITKEFEGGLSLEIRASQEDIERYLEGHIGELPAFVQHNSSLREEIKKTITEAVDGMFLLAPIYLSSLDDKTKPKAIRSALQNFQIESQHSGDDTKSQALTRAYEKAMDKINGQKKGLRDLAMQTLQWVTCAKRPLSTSELQHALSVEVEDVDFDKDNMSEIVDIVTVCAGLVTVDEGSDIIRLVHYTTQEYFERTQQHWFPNAEVEIATVCIVYMSFNAFESGSCRKDDEYEERLQFHPLYEYAACNWGHHARQAMGLSEKVNAFLGNSVKLEASHQALFANQYLLIWGRRPYYSQVAAGRITALHTAAYFGLEDSVSFLLCSKYPSDAEKDGHGSCLELSLQNDAYIDFKDTNGSTALSYASENAHESVVKLLLDRGANIETKSNYSETPLWIASNVGHASIVKLLLDRGADIETKSNNGETPLWVASNAGHVSVVKLLLDRGANIETKHNYCQTPLWVASMEGHASVVKLLLERGANVNIKDDSGWTLFSGVALYSQSHSPVLQQLIQHEDFDVSLSDYCHRTCLFHVAIYGTKSAFELLASHDSVDLGSKDCYGSTLLSLAVRHGNEELVEHLLITQYADLDIEDDFHRSPLWWAAKNGYCRISRILLDNAKKRGISLCDIGLPTKQISTSTAMSGMICDVCTMNIPLDAIFHHCGVCCDGDFDICAECFDRGARCPPLGHALERIKNTLDSVSELGRYKETVGAYN